MLAKEIDKSKSLLCRNAEIWEKDPGSYFDRRKCFTAATVARNLGSFSLGNKFVSNRYVVAYVSDGFVERNGQ